MADIARGSLFMGAADKAASAIESIINDQVADIIDQVAADGTITNARAIELKKRGAMVGAKVVSEVLGYHADLIDAAKAAGIDLPPPSDGKAELIAVVNGLIEPLSGGR